MEKIALKFFFFRNQRSKTWGASEGVGGSQNFKADWVGLTWYPKAIVNQQGFSNLIPRLDDLFRCWMCCDRQVSSCDVLLSVSLHCFLATHAKHVLAMQAIDHAYHAYPEYNYPKNRKNKNTAIHGFWPPKEMPSMEYHPIIQSFVKQPGLLNCERT